MIKGIWNKQDIEVYSQVQGCIWDRYSETPTQPGQLFVMENRNNPYKFPNCLCGFSTRQLELLFWRAGPMA